MAGRIRYLKEKNGRFYARVAVPKALRDHLGGKSELIEALGADRRKALRKHPEAVRRLLARIEEARRAAASQGPSESAEVSPSDIEELPTTFQLTGEILSRFAIEYYDYLLKDYEKKRAELPSDLEKQASYLALLELTYSGQIGMHNPLAMIRAHGEHETLLNWHKFLQDARRRRLNGMKIAYQDLNVKPVDAVIEQFVTGYRLPILRDTREWRELGLALMRAEMEALTRMLERDEGNYSGEPRDPLLRPKPDPDREMPPVPLRELFRDYIAARSALGKHQDGGANWEPVLSHLIAFLGHDDARRIRKSDLIRWRDRLLEEGKSPKTIAGKYLAAVRALLRWAHENDRLPSNEAQSVRQEMPRRIRARESGFTDKEATRILRVCLNYEPSSSRRAINAEQPHITAAKRWVPLLLAHTGARTNEITQVRKEDFRHEAGRLIMRITPAAGSVKTGHFRDVPIHQQIIDLGFLDFLSDHESGPLFHSATDPKDFHVAAQATGSALARWLRRQGLIPKGVQANYGWRHRFKTLGRELGISDRVLDAIQGHAGRTTGDHYGDVTLAAKITAIDRFPSYDL